jgi:hypothetical protein
VTLQEAESLETGDRVMLNVSVAGQKVSPRTGTIRQIGSRYMVVEWDGGAGELYSRDAMLSFERYRASGQQ